MLRHEGFFLEKWIAHYGAIVGRENLFRRDSTETTGNRPSTLTGITTEVILDAPRRRIQNDRFIGQGDVGAGQQAPQALRIRDPGRL